MKPGIHPEYMASKITCACGRETETYATVEEIHVEICSHCHPFYTGRQKLVDTAGRVERFRRKYGSAADDSESEEEGESDASAEAPEADGAEAVEAEAGEAGAADEAAEADGAEDQSDEESAPRPVGAAEGAAEEPSDESDD